MNKDVLESKRYPEITFLAKKVSGKVSRCKAASTVQVQGVFHIHGADHDLTVSIPVEVTGSEPESHDKLHRAVSGVGNEESEHAVSARRRQSADQH